MIGNAVVEIQTNNLKGFVGERCYGAGGWKYKYILSRVSFVRGAAVR